MYKAILMTAMLGFVVTAEANPCAGKSVYCNGATRVGYDSCGSYVDYEKHEVVYYPYCSIEDTSPTADPCAGDVVQCVHYNPGRVETHIGYDSCGSYVDYNAHEVVVYPYCSKK